MPLYLLVGSGRTGSLSTSICDLVRKCSSGIATKEEKILRWLDSARRNIKTVGGDGEDLILDII